MAEIKVKENAAVERKGCEGCPELLPVRLEKPREGVVRERTERAASVWGKEPPSGMEAGDLSRSFMPAGSKEASPVTFFAQAGENGAAESSFLAGERGEKAGVGGLETFLR